MVKTETTEKATELTGGLSSFKLVGKAKIDATTFGGAEQKDGKLWKGVNSTFGVQCGEGIQIYAKVQGGYMVDTQVIKVFQEKGGMFDVAWADRKIPEIIEQAARRSRLRGNLEKDESGKPIFAEFLNEIDFEEYLKNNLKDGMDIKVSGDVDYSVSADGSKVYRNYRVKSVYLNEPYESNGDKHEPEEPSATMRQTYLVNEDSLPRRWEATLEKDGQVTANVFVPQYFGKKNINGQYVPYKKTDPVPQTIVIKATQENMDVQKRLAKYLLEVKKNVVREVSIVNIINEGYDQSSGEVEVSDELRELIDAGIISEEEVQSQVTVRGTKVSELILHKPVIIVDKQTGKSRPALTDDKYAPEALVVPEIDDEEESTPEEDFLTSLGTTADYDGEDPFNNIFG